MANEATGRCHEVLTGYNKDVTNEIVSASTKRFLAWPLNSTLATDKCHEPAVRAIVWAMKMKASMWLEGEQPLEIKMRLQLTTLSVIS
jgi:hypothetical protein